MADYQIILTPVDTFFFGGEKHDAETEKSDYFVVSNFFPQQTTLLGLLRYYLLLKNNCLNPRKQGKEQEAIEMIGEKSFDLLGVAQQFGKIEKLGPLYFLRDGVSYCFEPLGNEYAVSNSGALQKNGEPYTAKDGTLKLHLNNGSGDNRTLLTGKYEDNCVLYTQMQTGNEKGDNGESKENAFYKQTLVKMKPGWSFSLDVSINMILGDDTLFIPFGGERSLFKMELKNKRIQHNINFSKNKPGLYCVSDCFVQPNVLVNTMVAINTITSFRSLQSQVKHTENYDAFGKKLTGQKRSALFYLMGRGSVLYFHSVEERDAAAAQFENVQCQKIGFNHIIKST